MSVRSRVAELTKDVNTLKKHNGVLTKRIQDLSNLNQTSMINLNDELLEEKRKHSGLAEEVLLLKQQLTVAQGELKLATDAKLASEKKYTDEMMQHAEDIKVRKTSVQKGSFCSGDLYVIYNFQFMLFRN